MSPELIHPWLSPAKARYKILMSCSACEWCKYSCVTTIYIVSVVPEASFHLALAPCLPIFCPIAIQVHFRNMFNLHVLANANLPAISPLTLAKVFSAGLVVLFLAFFTVVKRVWFHPLSKIPGPRLAVATSWYQFYYDVVCNGAYSHQFLGLHKKYGEYFRDECSFCIPSLTQLVYCSIFHFQNCTDPCSHQGLRLFQPVCGSNLSPLHRINLQKLKSCRAFSPRSAL